MRSVYAWSELIFPFFTYSRPSGTEIGRNFGTLVSDFMISCVLQPNIFSWEFLGYESILESMYMFTGPGQEIRNLQSLLGLLVYFRSQSEFEGSSSLSTLYRSQGPAIIISTLNHSKHMNCN